MLYYAYGDALLTGNEAHYLHAKEQVQDLVRDVAKGARPKKAVDLHNGRVTAEMIADQLPTAGKIELMSLDVRPPSPGQVPSPIPWNGIGPTKPLTIDVRQVYTGKNPEGWFGDHRTMLLTSAVKSTSTYDAKPRAVNYLRKSTGRFESIARPRATEEGCTVLFHSPAMVDRSITVDVEIVFDEFPQDLFDMLSGALKAAATIPVFLPASTYLLAAGEITRLVGAAGETVLDHRPVFSVSSGIDLDLPGTIPTQAGFMLLTPVDLDHVDPTFRHEHSVKDAILVDSRDQPYHGDVPYVILAVDGSARGDLKDFAPTQASAAILSRFLGMQGGQSEPLGGLIDALKLYSDFTYRQRRDKIDKDLAAVPNDAAHKAQRDALTQERDAVDKNILTDVLRK